MRQGCPEGSRKCGRSLLENSSFAAWAVGRGRTMKRSKFTESLIAFILRQREEGAGRTARCGRLFGRIVVVRFDRTPTPVIREGTGRFWPSVAPAFPKDLLPISYVEEIASVVVKVVGSVCHANRCRRIWSATSTGMSVSGANQNSADPVVSSVSGAFRKCARRLATSGDQLPGDRGLRPANCHWRRGERQVIVLPGAVPGGAVARIRWSSCSTRASFSFRRNWRYRLSQLGRWRTPSSGWWKDGP
jgi:hypothetical protein